jgi:O-antigen biosynthesis protein
MTPSEVPLRKRVSHRLKEALYRAPALDAWLDARLESPRSAAVIAVRDALYFRLLPERIVRRSPLRPGAPLTRRARVLTLVPPEDTGGGSRPAQLAAELLRRGFAIDWTYALSVFPWPRARRPQIPGVRIRHVSDPPEGTAPELDLCLLEGPHPQLVAEVDDIARRQPGAIVVYDAIDAWEGSLGAGWYDRGAEDAAIARAAVLVASSELLRRELGERSGREVVLLPNAVDLHLFDPAIVRERPQDLVPGRPTVLYVGALWGEWVDVDLIDALAHALPAAEIHLLGPTGRRKLPALPNLHVLGPRPQTDVPAYIAAADVGIVPFATDRLAQAVSPLKAFEYLAMGVPVVATALAEVKNLPGVTVTATASEFIAAVATAIRSGESAQRLRASVHGDSWEARVDRLLAATGLATAMAASDGAP